MKIYLDNSATTKPRQRVVDEMITMLTEDYGNPSSLHRMGLDVEKKIEVSRKIIASYLKASKEEITFTAGGTESNNIAIQGLVNKYSRGKKHLITSKTEHSSVINIFKNFEEQGYHVTYIDVDKDGLIDLDQVKDSISDETSLISIMYVNNETGTVQPIEKIKEIINLSKQDIKLHIDGVQAFGKINMDIKSLGVDTFSFSGHKIHGPKGIGGLFIRKGLSLNPIVFGGGQERNVRSGTENTPGIIGLGVAVDELAKNFKEEHEKIQELKLYFYQAVSDNIEDIKLNSFMDDRSAGHILNISFRHTRGEVLLHYLESDNIYISTGSACSSNGKGKSSVLKALKLTDNEIDGAVRFSFSYENTKDQLDIVVESLKKAVEEIRKIIKR